MDGSAGSTKRDGDGRLFAAAAALLALHLVLGLSAARDKNAVFDEVPYVSVGYGYWKTGRYAQSREHPPAAKLLVGLPLLALSPRFDREAFLRDPSPGFEFGRRFLYASGNDADRLVLAARLPVLALSLAAGATLFFWAWRRVGRGGALLALSLYALDPNVLAHASLATLDAPLAAFSLFCVAAFDRHLRTRGRGSRLASGLFLGLACGSKTPGFLLVPALAAIALARRRVSSFLVVLPAGLLVFVGLYLPFGEPLAFLEALRHPFFAPEPAAAGTEPYRVFFWGEYGAPGFYLYYLGAMALKTPLPTLALLLVGGLARLSRGGRDAAAVALLPAAILVAVASLARRDVGIRYVLPAYPFLFLLAGNAADALRRLRAAGGVAGSALLACLAVGTVRASPDFLPYFHELAGGARGGIRYLDDSNVDWGQDLRRLARWIREERPSEYRYVYFGAAEPAYYGIDREEGLEAGEVLWPREGVAYAVSAHVLQRPETPLGGLRGLRFRWLDRFEPERTFGDSIYLYRFRFAGGIGPARPGEIDRLAWLEGGVRQGEEVLAANPRGSPAADRLRATLVAACEEAARLLESARPPDPAAAERARARARALAGG